MSLKFKLNSRGEVPVELQNLYVEREGAWVLDVEGAADAVQLRAKLDDFRTNNFALAKERDGDLMLIACWAHTRRGYHEALAESKLAARFVGRLGTFTQWKKNCARKKSRAATTRRTARLAKPASIAAAAPGNGVDPANDVATRITGSGHRLRLETVECTKLIRGRRRSGNRHQSRRKFDSAQCSWKAQLVVHWAS